MDAAGARSSRRRASRKLSPPKAAQSNWFGPRSLIRLGAQGGRASMLGRRARFVAREAACQATAAAALGLGSAQMNVNASPACEVSETAPRSVFRKAPVSAGVYAPGFRGLCIAPHGYAPAETWDAPAGTRQVLVRRHPPAKGPFLLAAPPRPSPMHPFSHSLSNSVAKIIERQHWL
ncbi:hypothetical protein BASA81_010124 [Batrachochytrium salamandrivorans]|nr:hypothetical protein BASA81_010124 [Batrachochytrium salamandrivorans]